MRSGVNRAVRYSTNPLICWPCLAIDSIRSNLALVEAKYCSASRRMISICGGFSNISAFSRNAAITRGVSSIITTTGFVTDNFAKWPAFSQTILLLLMFIGGSAGSTGGAIKCVRILLLLKQGYLELYRLVHPHAVIQVKLGHETVPPDVMKSVLGFFVLYLVVAILATIALSALGLDMITSFAAVAATPGNVGPGLGLYHPATTYSEAPALGKWILSFCMLVGRLEIYTVLVLLTPAFWKK